LRSVRTRPRRCALATSEIGWKRLIRVFDGKPLDTDQEWAETRHS
jgi:hypothetical protein